MRWRVFEKAKLRRWAQVSQDHPQEPKFRTRRALEPAGEEISGDVRDGTRIVCRRRDGSLAGKGDEIRTPDLDADAAGHQLFTPQPLASPARELRQFGLQNARIADVAREGLLGTERLLVAIREHGTIVNARRAFPHPLSVSAEQRPQQRIRGVSELAKSVDTDRLDSHTALAPQAR